MSIGKWEPKGTSSVVVIDQAVIMRWLSLADQSLEDIGVRIAGDDVQRYAHWMTLDQAPWEAVCQALNDDQIKLLMQFFTLAEQQCPDWQAGARSPVVWLGKVLKKRGAFPDREFVRWIKAHTDNRFLPYGDVLMR